MSRPARRRFLFSTPAEAAAFLAGVEYVNDSAVEARLDPADHSVVLADDEDKDDEERVVDRRTPAPAPAPAAGAPATRWVVTHGILREEWAEVTVHAATAEEAIARARLDFAAMSTADYEPGDVHGDHPTPYEARPA